MESDVDASGDETEVDDTLTRAHLRRARQTRSQAQQPQNPSVSVSRQHAPEKLAPTVPAGASALSDSQQDRHISSPTTSNTYFGQHMHDLREEMDAKMNDQVLVQNIYPRNMPMQSSTIPVLQHPEDTHSFPHSAQSSFGSENVPRFAHPFSVIDIHCPLQGDSFAVPMASNNAGFPYVYEGAFPSTPMSGHSNRSFHGLPLDPNAYY